MSNLRRKLAELLDVENRWDWDNYREFLHPQVEWVPEGDVIRGRKRYHETIVATHVQSAPRFGMHQMPEPGDGRHIATLPVGMDDKCSLDIFEFEDGLVCREWGYLLGCSAGWNGGPLNYGRGQEDANEVLLWQGVRQLDTVLADVPVIQMNAFIDTKSTAPAV